MGMEKKHQTITFEDVLHEVSKYIKKVLTMRKFAPILKKIWKKSCGFWNKLSKYYHKKVERMAKGKK